MSENSTITYDTGKYPEEVNIEEAGSGIFAISGDLGDGIFKKYKKKFEPLFFLHLTFDHQWLE